jgi:hypothetical protein
MGMMNRSALCTPGLPPEFLCDHCQIAARCRKGRVNDDHKRQFFAIEILSYLLGPKPTPTPGTRTFHFSGLRFASSDIILLHEKGRARRFSSGSDAPDSHSLSHLLRMTGAYLDSTKRELAKLVWRSPNLTVWEINRTGDMIKKDFTLSEMYDLWVHQFKKRAAPPTLKSIEND